MSLLFHKEKCNCMLLTSVQTLRLSKNTHVYLKCCGQAVRGEKNSSGNKKSPVPKEIIGKWKFNEDKYRAYLKSEDYEEEDIEYNLERSKQRYCSV